MGYGFSFRVKWCVSVQWWSSTMRTTSSHWTLTFCRHDMVYQSYKLCPTTPWFVLLAYDTAFLEELPKNKENYPKRLISSLRYIYDVLSLNYSRFCDYLNLIYQNELAVKDATDTQVSASYLDLHLKIVNGGILEIKLYDKRDDFLFVIVNLPFISRVSHIEAIRSRVDSPLDIQYMSCFSLANFCTRTLNELCRNL